MSQMNRTSTATAVKPASPAQIKYLTDLLAKRGANAPAELRATVKAALAAGTVKDGRVNLIDSMLAVRPVTTSPAPKAQVQKFNIPTGDYALRDESVVKFYRVDSPTEGKWAGFTFLAACASDDRFKITDKVRKAQILSRIAADLAGAAKLYGDETGHCSFCRKQLTHPESLERGCGRRCAEKHGLI